jgi:hypothetical protein
VATLDQAVEDVLDAIADALDAAAAETGGGLDEVLTVVRGDRSRPVPEMPALWVIPQAATYEQADFGDAEQWTLDVTIAALVKSDDPAEGAATARRLAARARSVALTVRHSQEWLTDATSRTFDAAVRRSTQNRALFWTDATIRVTFTVTE